MVWFYARTWRYQRIHRDFQSFLRDEAGLMNGPGAKAGLTWRDISYPTGEEHEPAAATGGKLIKLRIPKRTWADDVAEASIGQGSAPTPRETSADSAALRQPPIATVGE